MLANPKVGQVVTIHYAKDKRDTMPYHGHRGIVVAVGVGKPKNHLIQIGTVQVVVPCGNLLKGGV